ncbi:MAG: site-specific integrase, partial [Deltaproteobacteria bacterium]|nr:site-specific integrase [Deltaproteobacteria bacterium]
DGMTFKFREAAEEWLVKHAEIKKQPKPVATDKQMLRDNLLPFLGSIALMDITPGVVENLILRMLKKNSKSTVNKNLELLRTIFNYNIKRRRILYNPVSIIGLFKQQAPNTDYWEKQEARQFLEYVEGKYVSTGNDLKPLYVLALNTGMRAGEVLALSWRDVDLNTGLITVRRSYDSHQKCIKDTTKGFKVRHVPINNALYAELSKMKKSSKSDLVFSTISGNPKDRSNVTHYFQRDSKEAGVRKIRFHDLRHTFASHFMMNGGSIFELQIILGHSDVKTTMRYAHYGKGYLVGKTNIVEFSSTGKVVNVDFKNKKASNE